MRSFSPETYNEQPIIGHVSSERRLESACRDNLRLDTNTVYLPGIMLENTQWKEMVNGRYGIGQLDVKTKNVVAVAGFIVQDGSLIITQTPQPLRPSYLKELGDKVLPRLRSRDFRGGMIRQLIEVARSIGMEEVLAVPAARYTNVEKGIADYDYVYDRVDNVLKRCGFQLVDQYYEYVDY